MWDEKRDAWYVSNFGGNVFADDSGAAPINVDGNGYIAKLSATGEIDSLNWITGLHAPKGLAVHAGKLYAADVGQLVVMDIDSASIQSVIPVPDAQFLNGVATNPQNGDVYVSDMFTDRIYRYSGGVMELFLESADLESPNGLHVEGDTLIVGAWGVITDPATFGTEVKGRVKRVNLLSKSVTSVGGPTANIDGIFQLGDAYIISDWVTGELLRVRPDGTSTVLQSGFNGSADIGFDPTRRIVAVPEMTPSGEPGRVFICRTGLVQHLTTKRQFRLTSFRRFCSAARNA